MPANVKLKCGKPKKNRKAHLKTIETILENPYEAMLMSTSLPFQPVAAEPVAANHAGPHSLAKQHSNLFQSF